MGVVLDTAAEPALPLPFKLLPLLRPLRRHRKNPPPAAEHCFDQIFDKKVCFEEGGGNNCSCCSHSHSSG